MSYSRWSIGKTWYAFWSTSSGKTKAEQVLCLWADMSQTKDWTYEELNTWTAETVLEHYEGITKEEAEEAFQYITYFLEDVDNEYSS